MSERGKYIVLEGGDGTGKTTQTIMLDAFIRSLGGDTLRVFNPETDREEPLQEPGGTPKANELRKRIKDKSIDRTPWDNVKWFTEARISLNEELIQPALDRGQYVLSARNWLSSIAYQGYGEGIPLQDIEDYTREQLGDSYMNPDFVAILAIKDELNRRRRMEGRDEAAIEKDTFESKPEEFQTNMQSGYVQFAELKDIQLIDASRSKVEVFSSVLELVKPHLETL